LVSVVTLVREDSKNSLPSSFDQNIGKC
jgi:hypothetical protein